MWNAYPELQVILRHTQLEYMQHLHLYLLADTTSLWQIVLPTWIVKEQRLCTRAFVIPVWRDFSFYENATTLSV